MKRSRGRPPGRTDQGLETEARLFDAATRLFAERGYEATTMRAIAADADVSPGLLYRYFPSKAAVVVALYDRLSRDFEARCEALPAGPWFTRFERALELSLDSLGPHRLVLRSVLAILLADPELGLFSGPGSPARDRVRAQFVQAVRGATDAPSSPVAETLGRVLDLAQLGVILWWLLDRSPDRIATRGLQQWIGSFRRTAPALLWVPGVASALARFDGLANSALYGGEGGHRP